MTLFFVQATNNVSSFWSDEDIEYEHLFMDREAADEWASQVAGYEQVRVVEEEIG